MPLGGGGSCGNGGDNNDGGNDNKGGDNDGGSDDGGGDDNSGGGGGNLWRLSAPFLTPVETEILVLLSASVKRFAVSHMPDFKVLFE